MTRKVLIKLIVSIAFVVMTTTPLFSQDKSEEELAKETQNPIADLISVPLQFNADYGIGPAGAAKYTLNVQPVIPFSLNQDWNLITRTIVPLIKAESPTAIGGDTSGMGDILQSFFFTPKKMFNGWIMGAGPAFLYPTATDEKLGGEKWCAGPTAVVLKQESGFTYGALANHLWSFAGWNDQPNISATFVQPFVGYTTKTYTTLTLNTESTYDWNNSQWTIPINVLLSQILKIGNQPISLQLGYRYYAEAPKEGPYWGLRFMVSFLFPK